MPEPAPPYTSATGCVCSLCLTERLAQAQAALDRLAEVGVEDVARVIAETPSEYPSGIATIWHGLPWAETSAANQATYRAMATAVLTLLRARVPGPV